MSTDEPRGTLPSRVQHPQNPDPQEPPAQPSALDPLARGERNRLHRLGYKNEHIVGLGLAQARRIIQLQIPRIKDEAASALPPSGHSQAAAAYSDERVDDIRGPEPTAGLEILIDEFTQRCIDGDSPLDAVINECQAAYPNDVIRLVDPTLPPVAGTQFQQIHRTNGDAVTVGQLFAQRMPRDVYQKSYVVPNQRLSEEMSGQRASEQERRLNLAESRYVPLEGEGLKFDRNLERL